ncbi:MAG: hypothetical protein KIT31_39875 [Deltaproteobacteria bacterium]|nr:hypothetical protein [Deltaproteobacteria bacterium]
MTVTTTSFGDLRNDALAVFRVQTQQSVYLVGFHEARGKKFAIVRGEPGTDREHLVVRDSDPRVGEQSMFEVPYEAWVGKTLEVATMTSSTILAVARVTDWSAIAHVHREPPASEPGDRNPWARPDPSLPSGPGAPGAPPSTAPAPASWAPPPPPGMSSSPRIMIGLSRGTNPVAGMAATPPPASQQHQLAKQVVVGQGPSSPADTPEPELPYPKRHVRYAENVAALLRSIARRDRLFEDVAADRALKERLRRALDDSVSLLETIRRRDRT